MLTKTGRYKAAVETNFCEFSLLFGLGLQKNRSKLRNKLGIEKAEKLVKVDRFLRRDKESDW